MSELISGKEALKHVAECTVQYQHPDEPKGVWTTITDHFWDQYSLGIFLNEDTRFKFRLKPSTITINGIEVPAPFEPKREDSFYYLGSTVEKGYSYKNWDSERFKVYSSFGAWRTEDEIKQVVAALRSVFNAR